jgi:hypothetical protein
MDFLRLFKVKLESDDIVWYYDELVKCAVCFKEIDYYASAIIFFNKRMSNSYLEFVHDNCYCKFNHNKSWIVKETFTVFLNKDLNYILQLGGIPIMIRPPDLINIKSNFSVFESEKILSEKTLDKTVYANKESWKYSQIGANINPLLEEKEKIIDDITLIKIARDEIRAIPYVEWARVQHEKELLKKEKQKQADLELGKNLLEQRKKKLMR